MCWCFRLDKHLKEIAHLNRGGNTTLLDVPSVERFYNQFTYASYRHRQQAMQVRYKDATTIYAFCMINAFSINHKSLDQQTMKLLSRKFRKRWIHYVHSSFKGFRHAQLQSDRMPTAQLLIRQHSFQPPFLDNRGKPVSPYLNAKPSWIVLQQEMMRWQRRLLQLRQSSSQITNTITVLQHR